MTRRRSRRTPSWRRSLRPPGWPSAGIGWRSGKVSDTVRPPNQDNATASACTQITGGARETYKNREETAAPVHVADFRPESILRAPERQRAGRPALGRRLRAKEIGPAGEAE